MVGMDIAPFQNIDISVSSFDIEFVTSDTFGVRIESGFLDKSYGYGDQNGTLTISDQDSGIWSFFHLDLRRLFPSPNASRITVYIPASASFDNVTIKTTSGNITIPQLNSKDIYLNAASGDMKLQQITAANDIEAHITSGSFTLQNAAADTVTAVTASGGVSVAGLNARGFYAKSASGDVTLDGIVQSLIQVSATSGDVRLNLIGARSDYGKSLHAASGAIKVDGAKTGNFEEAGGDGNLQVKTTSGNITVTFSPPQP